MKFLLPLVGSVLLAVSLSAQAPKPAPKPKAKAEPEVAYPPTLPGGKVFVTDTVPEFLQPPATMLPGEIGRAHV